jgi:hypothetical protein
VARGPDRRGVDVRTGGEALETVVPVGEADPVEVFRRTSAPSENIRELVQESDAEPPLCRLPIERANRPTKGDGPLPPGRAVTADGIRDSVVREPVDRRTVSRANCRRTETEDGPVVGERRSDVVRDDRTSLEPSETTRGASAVESRVERMASTREEVVAVEVRGRRSVAGDEVRRRLVSTRCSAGVEAGDAAKAERRTLLDGDRRTRSPARGMVRRRSSEGWSLDVGCSVRRATRSARLDGGSTLVVCSLGISSSSGRPTLRRQLGAVQDLRRLAVSVEGSGSRLFDRVVVPRVEAVGEDDVVGVPDVVRDVGCVGEGADIGAVVGDADELEVDGVVVDGCGLGESDDGVESIIERRRDAGSIGVGASSFVDGVGTKVVQSGDREVDVFGCETLDAVDGDGDVDVDVAGDEDVDVDDGVA